jgi:hypothetical protein
MDVIGAVTAGAAGLAAVLAGVNLYVSGRRELDKWTRETLVDTFALFLDASFKHGTVCHTILVDSPPEPELYRLREAEIAAHNAEAAALTRLRLLAPAQVVEDARALINFEYQLAESCFSDPPRTADTAAVSGPIRKARRQFLESARATLGLRETAGTGSFDTTNNWRAFRTKVNQQKDHITSE